MFLSSALEFEAL